jgi:Branched-chain amino acid transport system / permease component
MPVAAPQNDHEGDERQRDPAQTSPLGSIFRLPGALGRPSGFRHAAAWIMRLTDISSAQRGPRASRARASAPRASAPRAAAERGGRLSLVPAPLQDVINPQSVNYQLRYGIVAVILAFVIYRFVRLITDSPYGRSLRAMRDNDVVADSLGKNLRSLRTSSLVIGGAIAGLSGDVLVGFINLWDPRAWGYAETVVLFAAVIIGGLGNHRGAVLGAILVPVAFEEATRYIPPVPNHPDLIPALQWVVIGVLIVLFLWFRPQGILPERRRVIVGKRAGAVEETAAAEVNGEPPLSPIPASEANGEARGGRIAASTNDTRPDALGVNLRREPFPGDVILACSGLSRSLDRVRAVDDVTMSFRRGRLTGIIGPNGAGKSTAHGDALRDSGANRGIDHLSGRGRHRPARISPGATGSRADLPAC